MRYRPRPYRPVGRPHLVPECYAVAFGSGFLGVLEDDAYTWWSACTQAVWSEAVALRGVFLMTKIEPATRDHWQHLFCEQLAPRRLVRVTELLVQEQVLDREVANRIEACILAQTTATGCWSLAPDWLERVGYTSLTH